MLYRELVARISEVTRTLIDEGTNGKFDSGSARFHLDKVPNDQIVPGMHLIVEGPYLSERYVVRDVDRDRGTLVVDREFLRSDVASWKIYEPGVSEEDVRRVLLAFPDVIMECDEGEQVKTYLGTFRMTRRKRKRVKDPQGRWTYSEERLVARIRPGKRLQKDVPSGPSNPTPKPDPDEDPTV